MALNISGAAALGLPLAALGLLKIDDLRSRMVEREIKTLLDEILTLKSRFSIQPSCSDDLK